MWPLLHYAGVCPVLGPPLLFFFFLLHVNFYSYWIYFKSSLAFVICTSDNMALSFGVPSWCSHTFSHELPLIGLQFLQIYKQIENKLGKKIVALDITSLKATSNVLIIPKAVIFPVNFVVYLYQKGKLFNWVPLWPNGFVPSIALLKHLTQTCWSSLIKEKPKEKEKKISRKHQGNNSALVLLNCFIFHITFSLSVTSLFL